MPRLFHVLCSKKLLVGNKHFRQSTFDVNKNLMIRVTLHRRQENYLSMGYVPETKRKQFHIMKLEDIFNCVTNTIKLYFRIF